MGYVTGGSAAAPAGAIWRPTGVVVFASLEAPIGRPGVQPDPGTWLVAGGEHFGSTVTMPTRSSPLGFLHGIFDWLVGR
jgi:hypothetical protein